MPLDSSREPVLVASVARAVLLALVSVGIVHATAHDVDAWVNAGVPAVVVVIETATAIWTRRKVTPMAAPRLPESVPAGEVI